MSDLNSPIIRDFRQHYVIKSAIDPIVSNSVSNSLKAVIFRDVVLTQTFIRHLDVPFDYWRKLLHHYNVLPRYFLDDIGIINHASELLVRQKLNLYPIKTPNDNEHPVAKRTIETQDNVAYLFADVSILLTTQPAEIKKFNSEKQAEDFLNSLKLDDNKLASLAQELDIKIPNSQYITPTTNKLTHNTTDTASANNATLSAPIISALASGSVVVIVNRYIRTPPKDKEILEDIPPSSIMKTGLNETPDDEFKAITVDLEDEFEKNLGPHFSQFNGLEYTLKTDMGEEHTGTIENGKIYIAKAKINNSFKIKIKHMPTFMDA